jgi:hypothetical protein
VIGYSARDESSDQDVGQKPRPSYAALDRSARRRGLHDALAARAGQFHANMPDHQKVRWDAFQHFRRAPSTENEDVSREGIFLKGRLHHPAQPRETASQIGHPCSDAICA